MAETRAPVVVLDPAVTNGQIDRVMELVGDVSPIASVARGDVWAALAVGDGSHPVDLELLRGIPAVERIVEVAAPYRLASREVFESDTTVVVGREPGRDPGEWGPGIGGRSPIAIMVGCRATALSEERLRLVAGSIREVGGSLLFAGEVGSAAVSGDPAVAGLADVERVRGIAEQAGLALCVEVSDYRQISRVSKVADVLQVGSRNMQDFNLLRELGRADRPVLLKRGFGATVEEFLLAAEYVLCHGNGRVILCESGIRTFDTTSKPRFEINAIPVIKQATHLPLMADPAQATAHARLVPAVARAAIAAGADGLVLEVAEDETEEFGEAVIDVSTLRALMTDLEPIAQAVGRRL